MLVLFTYDEINITSMAKSNFRGTYFVEHRGIMSVVTKKAVVSREKGIEVMGIRVNKLVRASLSKVAHPSHANPEMHRAELVREKAMVYAYLNGGAL